MLALYALTMLLSAALIFVVQPMVAKMLLPALGGSSAVWTTCMLFFQAMLLAGYLYAHAGARWLAPRVQAALHIGLMVIALIVLPITITPEVRAHESPVMWLLVELVVSVGLPFLVISASAPMFQHWFGKTSHPTASDPYHLYAASNVGSLVALLGYPLVLEPSLGIREQSEAWTVGYIILIIAATLCAFVMARFTPGSVETTAGEPVRARTIATWVALAFVPSSLMLGVTQHLTTDIASVPLFWVVPLALYLTTFILVFARKRLRLPRWMVAALPWLVLTVLSASMYRIPMFVEIAGHLALFFLLALYFHGTLADKRPDVGNLTQFYVWMSVGGALGGLFNALFAPLIFDRLVEYHMVIVLAVVMIPTWVDLFPRDDYRPHMARFLAPTLTLIAGGVFLYSVGFLRWSIGWRIAVSMAVVGVAVFLSWWKPRLTHVGLALVFLTGVAELLVSNGIIAQERSFFAAYRVSNRTYHGHPIRKFSHGTTSHGAQSLEPEFENEPIGYHHPSGPVGQVLERIPHKRVGVVGLGIGAMAPYATPGKHFDFYEIDPLVETLAREYFTYLERCQDRCPVFVGDGRLLLESVPDETYDILFLDAYNSDAVPTHLLTREALQLYVAKLKPRGVLVFNVSNRFLDVESVVGALARDAGYIALNQLHVPPRKLKDRYVMTASYTVMAREQSHLGAIARDPRWTPSDDKARVWTDDYSNVLEVFDWD